MGLSPSLRRAGNLKLMNQLVPWLAGTCAALLSAGASAQSPGAQQRCVEPFATSRGYALTPHCPRKPLTAMVDPLNLRPLPDAEAAREADALRDPDARYDPLRFYEPRTPGTELYVTPSPLRNQWMYNPGQLYTPGGQQFPTSPRDAASDFVFGVRVPF